MKIMRFIQKNGDVIAAFIGGFSTGFILATVIRWIVVCSGGVI
jgi:hypothetical protein